MCSYLGLAAALVLHVGHDLAQAVLGLLGVVSPLVKSDDVLPLLEDSLGGERDIDGEAVTTGPLPPGTANPTAADLVQTTGRVFGYLVAAESEDNGCDIVGLESLDKLLWENCPGHGGTSVGGNRVDIDVVLDTLEGQSTGQAKDGAFLLDA